MAWLWFHKTLLKRWWVRFHTWSIVCLLEQVCHCSPTPGTFILLASSLWNESLSPSSASPHICSRGCFQWSNKWILAFLKLHNIGSYLITLYKMDPFIIYFWFSWSDVGPKASYFQRAYRGETHAGATAWGPHSEIHCPSLTATADVCTWMSG